MNIKPSYEDLTKRVSELEIEMKDLKGKGGISSLPFKFELIVDNTTPLVSKMRTEFMSLSINLLLKNLA